LPRKLLPMHQKINPLEAEVITITEMTPIMECYICYSQKDEQDFFYMSK
jgi:hypothetical protein